MKKTLLEILMKYLLTDLAHCKPMSHNPYTKYQFQCIRTCFMDLQKKKILPYHNGC